MSEETRHAMAQRLRALSGTDAKTAYNGKNLEKRPHGGKQEKQA
jgi:hypothetical protein